MTWTSSKILAAIVNHNGCATDFVLADITGLTEKQVRDALNKLRVHGFVTRDKNGCNRLTAAGDSAHRAGLTLTSGPRPGSHHTGHRAVPAGLRQRVWNALRMGRKFTLADLLLVCIDGDERDPESNILKYLQALARAGYARRFPIRETPGTPRSNGAIRWLLLRDTGPIAPVWRVKRQCLWDANLDAETCLGALAPVAARAMDREARP